MFITLLRAFGLLSYVDGSAIVPPQTIMENGLPYSNPAYLQWQATDSMVLTWINATLSLDLLQTIMNRSANATARDAWQALESLFLDQQSTRLMQLKLQLQTLKKGSDTIIDFLQKLKSICDALFAIGHSVLDANIVLHALAGLGQEYELFVTAITTKSPLPSFLNLCFRLLTHELRLQQFLPLESSHTSALFASKGKGYKNSQKKTIVKSNHHSRPNSSPPLLPTPSSSSSPSLQ